MPTYGAPSLASMARRQCTRYIRNLHDAGACPIHLLLPLLNKIDNPDQLHALELKSPQVLGNTKEAWINMIKRDIPKLGARMEKRGMSHTWEDVLFAPENADRWWKVYRKLKREVDAEAKATDKWLADQLSGISATRSATTAPIVHRKLVGQGKNKFAKAQYDLNAEIHRKGGTSGKTFFDRVRTGAVTKSAARLRTPTHLLKPNLGQSVRKAPAILVEDLREKKQREAEQQELERLIAEKRKRAEERGEIIRPPTVGGPGTMPQVRTSRRNDGPSPPLHGPITKVNGQPYDLTKDREARLRALKTGMTLPKDNVRALPSRTEIAKLTSDFLEDDDGDGHHNQQQDDDEDLFGCGSSKSPPVATTIAKPMPMPMPMPVSSPARSASPQVISKRQVSPLSAIPSRIASPQVGTIVRKRRDPFTATRPVKR